ncbi:DUF221-domain-containing protein [Martensiomyces pterosporus]|nr:DUF221-domain-containing protein [Martensiomyces pterosporus]
MHASDLLTQSVFSLLIGGAAFLAFCLLRFRWPDVYAPRARLLYAAPARMGKTLLGWISMTLHAKDFDIMYSVGLDALLVLRLFKMLSALAVAGSIIGLCILVPLKIMLDTDDHSAAKGSDKQKWTLYDSVIEAAMGSERPLVVHFAFAYVFTALVYFYFARFAYQAISLRWHYLLRVRNTRPARSIMVTGIPEELATEQALKRHFERGGLGEVVSVEIVPRIARVGVLVRRRAKLLRMIEEHATAILGNPCQAEGYDRELLYRLLTAHGEGSDRDEAWQLLRQWSIPRLKTEGGARKLERMIGKMEQLLARFHHTDGVIQKVRHEWFASYDGKRDRSSTVGFVTFADAASAHLSAQSFSYSQPFQLRTELAPEARDIFWDNITLPLSSRLTRGALSLSAYFLIVVYWVAMASLLSTLVSIDSLEEYFPRLAELANKNKWLNGLLRYTIPAFTLSLVNACVPYILSWIAGLSGIQSRSEIQSSVLRRYFLFLFTNVLLTFQVSSTIFRDYEKWIDNPAEIPKMFATNLPKVAPFFMDYIILYGLGYYPIQLLQLGSISLAVFRRMVCRTPRQFADALRPNYIDWAFILPQPMLIFVIMATYSSLAPLIFVLAALYYMIAYVVTKYLVYYVYSRQFETAGAFIIPVLKLLAGSLWNYYVLIIGLCALRGAFGYVALLLPLLWVNGYLLAFVSRQFYQNAKFLPADLWSAHQSAGYASTASQMHSSPPATAEAELMLGRDQRAGKIEPDEFTDFEQSPVSLLDGVLDQGLAVYEHPYLVGNLPTFWLPMKKEIILL